MSCLSWNAWFCSFGPSIWHWLVVFVCLWLCICFLSRTMTGMVPSKQVRLELAMLLIEISYIPRMEGEMGTTEQIIVLQKVCQAIVARTGFTMFTATLRAMGTATQQADIHRCQSTTTRWPCLMSACHEPFSYLGPIAFNSGSSYLSVLQSWCGHRSWTFKGSACLVLQHKGPHREWNHPAYERCLVHYGNGVALGGAAGACRWWRSLSQVNTDQIRGFWALQLLSLEFSVKTI